MAEAAAPIRQPREPDDLLRLPEVTRETGLARATIYRLMKDEKFPKARKLTDKLNCWRWDEIAEWKRTRPHAQRVS